MTTSQPMGTSPLSADHVLTTTRAVRRKLDLDRPVPRSVIRECLEIALQAPTGSNRQNWHFVVVTDPAVKSALGELYRRGGEIARAQVSTLARIDPADTAAYGAQTARVMSSAGYLFDHIQDVPAMLIPCVTGRPDPSGSAYLSTVGSVIQAAWSFMLAARARNIGSVWTTVHLAVEAEVAALLAIPYPEVTQVALIPFGYVVGDPFKPAAREPLELVTHWDHW
jgi:nitroreductase